MQNKIGNLSGDVVNHGVASDYSKAHTVIEGNI
jgi:hypothetical protein